MSEKTCKLQEGRKKNPMSTRKRTDFYASAGKKDRSRGLREGEDRFRSSGPRSLPTKKGSAFLRKKEEGKQILFRIARHGKRKKRHTSLHIKGTASLLWRGKEKGCPRAKNSKENPGVNELSTRKRGGGEHSRDSYQVLKGRKLCPTFQENRASMGEKRRRNRHLSLEDGSLHRAGGKEGFRLCC